MMNGEKRKGKEKAYLEIKLSELEQGPVRIDCDIPIEWLKKRMTFCEYSAAPISSNVALEVQPTGNGILIRGRIRAEIATQCGTCLNDITYELTPRINTYLVPRAEASKVSDDIELTPEDLDREYYEGDSILLDEIIGDAIMLEMPMNPKCENNCKGLVEFSESTDTQSVDPRLAPLLGIKIKKER